MIQLGKLLLILRHQLVTIYYHVWLHPVDGIDDGSCSCTRLQNLAVGTEIACQRYQPVGNLGWRGEKLEVLGQIAPLALHQYACHSGGVEVEVEALHLAARPLAAGFLYPELHVGIGLLAQLHIGQIEYIVLERTLLEDFLC